MIRWSVQVEQTSGLQPSPLEMMGSGICISHFMEGPRLTSVQTHSKRRSLQQDITIQEEKDFLRVGFPPSVVRISSHDETIWGRPQETSSLNNEVIIPRADFLRFHFQNGDSVRVCISSATWLQKIKASTTLSVTAGILSFHLLLLGLLSLHISFSQQTEELALDISQVEVLVQSTPALTTQSQSTAAPSEQKWNQLLKGMNLKSSKVSLASPDKSAPEFPKITESSRRDFFGYEASAPKIVSSPGTDINAQQIADSLRPFQARLKECYNEALFLDSRLKGRANLMIRVGSTGKIESLAIQGLDGSSQSQNSLQSCFHRVLSSARLPTASRDFAVSQSLVLYQ
jgi:hypothetical protein